MRDLVQRKISEKYICIDEFSLKNTFAVILTSMNLVKTGSEQDNFH